ncbi:hypothetical protein AAK894_11195 [Lachnospiraceae bacterium 46-61]
MAKCITILFLALIAYGQFSNDIKEIKQQQNVLIIRVDDKYYYSEGKESEFGTRCGVMDGEITSTVEQTKTPNKNNQSNFGKGYGYQYIDKNIEVNMDGKWIVFETIE